MPRKSSKSTAAINRKVPAAKTRRRARTSVGAVRSPETHQAILDAAEVLLAERGYGGFSMDALVRRAGSSKPTIYRWWRNKAALIIEVYERASAIVLDETDTGSLRGDLVLRLTKLWRWWDETWAGEALRSIIAEAQLDPRTLAELRDGFVPRRELYLRPVFDRAIARGELRDSSLADSAIAHLIGTSWLYLLTGRLHERQAIEPHIEALLHGLPFGSNRSN